MNQKAVLALLLLGALVVAGQRPNCDSTNSWAQFADPTNCANYYRCEHNQAILYTCSSDLLYDKNTKSCNWAENVQCDNVIVDPKPTPATCPAHEDDQHPTHLSHPTDCGKFYKCWNGIPYLMDCPGGQHWNAVMMYCDYPEHVHCVAGPNNQIPPGEGGINKLPYKSA